MDIPIIPVIGELFKGSESHQRALFSIVKGQEKVDAIVKATQSFIGDLEKENTGLIFTITVDEIFGKNNLL